MVGLLCVRSIITCLSHIHSIRGISRWRWNGVLYCLHAAEDGLSLFKLIIKSKPHPFVDEAHVTPTRMTCVHSKGLEFDHNSRNSGETGGYGLEISCLNIASVRYADQILACSASYVLVQ